MKIYAISIRVLSDILLQTLHHLLSDSIFSVGLQNAESQNISVKLAFKVLKTYSVGPDNDIVVVGESGMFGVFVHDFNIETGAILNGEGLIVEFTQQVDIFIVDFSNRDGEDGFLFGKGLSFGHKGKIKGLGKFEICNSK